VAARRVASWRRCSGAASHRPRGYRSTRVQLVFNLMFAPVRASRSDGLGTAGKAVGTSLCSLVAQACPACWTFLIGVGVGIGIGIEDDCTGPNRSRFRSRLPTPRQRLGSVSA
jgi:hypothetical protein